ncbi:MFS transporter [Streptomyces physcomitrii]|uniref:MFS transporter n=1 Tax=Streptomyces physcomitrii TaxID=2724184 RepID=UPI0033EE4FAE
MTAPDARSRSARRAVFTAFAVQGLTFASIMTQLARIKDDFDLSDLDILGLLAAVSVTSALGSLAAGSLARRRGSALTLRAGLTGVSLGAVLPGFAGSVPALVLTTCVYGFFVGAVDPALNMQGVAVQDRYGRSVISGFHAMWSAAAVAGAGLASLTIGLGWPLPLSLGLVCLAGLALNAATGHQLLGTAEGLGRDAGAAPAAGTDLAAATPTALAPNTSAAHGNSPSSAPNSHVPAGNSSSSVPNSQTSAGNSPASGDSPAPGSRLAARLPWWPFLLVAVPTFAMWVGDSATSVWSGIYLQDGLGTAAETAPLAYGAYQAVLLLVRLVGDRLIARFGTAATVRMSGVLATAALALVVAAPSVPVVIAAFALLGGGLSLISPLSFVAAARLDPENGDRAIARINIANYVGYLVAAFGVALVSDAWGERTMFLVPLVCVLLLPLMAARFAPPEGDGSARPDAGLPPRAGRSPAL